MVIAPVDLALDAAADAARRRPDHPAVVSLNACAAEERVQTWAELDRTVDDVTRALAHHGVKAGHRVAIWTRDAAVATATLFACDRLGAVFAPLHRDLSSSAVNDRVARLQARVVVTGDPRRRDGNNVVSPSLAPSDANASRRVLGASGAMVLPAAGHPSWHQRLAGWCEAGCPDTVARDAWVLFTSGTTGRAKAAVLTRANLVSSAMGSALRLGVKPDDRWLACMPLDHVGGLSILWRSAWMGTTVVALPRFSVEGVARALAEQRISLLSVVPTMLVRLLRAGVDPGSSMRAVLVGGGPAPMTLLADARAAGWPVCPTYGLTEASSQVATLGPNAPVEALGTTGPPLPGTRVRIGRTGHDGVGEIEVRGPTVMRGYLDEPTDTPSTIRDGWLRTGDLGRLHGDRLEVVTRRTDLIVSGGENVYPREVESVLGPVSGVSQLVVVGVPDAEWGQRVVGVVVPVRESDVATVVRALNEVSLAQLAPHQRPRGWQVVDTLPVNLVGKVDRLAAARLAAVSEPTAE